MIQISQHPVESSQVHSAVPSGPPQHIGMVMYPGMVGLDFVGPHAFLAGLMNVKVHLLWKNLDIVPAERDLRFLPGRTALFAETASSSVKIAAAQMMISGIASFSMRPSSPPHGRLPDLPSTSHTAGVSAASCSTTPFGALLSENYAALKIAFSHGIRNQQESTPAGLHAPRRTGV